MARALSLVAVLLCVAGCGRGPAATSATADGKKKPVIAVIPKAISHEFWKSVHAGAVEGAKEAGVEIIWKGPITESDREQQINVVEDFITRAVDGICLAPLDSQALMPAVADAARSKIPVLIFDSGLDDTQHVVSFVATDNYHGGQLAAREIGRLLGGHGRLVVLRYMPGSQSTTLREDGCLDTIKREFPQIEVVSSGEFSGDTADKALDQGPSDPAGPGRSRRRRVHFDPASLDRHAAGLGRARAGRQGEVHRL